MKVKNIGNRPLMIKGTIIMPNQFANVDASPDELQGLSVTFSVPKEKPEQKLVKKEKEEVK